jgi:anti-sigma B factor antagonist
MTQGRATARQAGNVAIVDLSGRITVAGGTGSLRCTIKELVAAGHKNVLLNLRDLTYLDSAGLGELVEACTTLRNQGGDMKLVNPQERIMNLLRMTKLSTMFSIFADEQAALQSF